MASKKDLVISVLATFCLTSTLFMIATTRSAEYDPWVDLDGDGKITILDVVQMTRIYGTEGDPTRNVNITNFPLDENGHLIISIAPTDKTIVVCENLTVDITPGVDNYFGSIETFGYAVADILYRIEKPEYYQLLMGYNYRAGNVSYCDAVWSVPSSQSYRDMIAVHSPSIEFFFRSTDWNSVNVTLVVYLHG